MRSYRYRARMRYLPREAHTSLVPGRTLMRTAITALTLLLPFGLITAARQQRIQEFSVIVAYTPNSWAVECEKGCDWTASFTCPDACNALVDSRGVVTLGEIRGPDPKF